MLTFEQMFVRFVIALVLGALLGLERELVGKESAGIRTTMLVTSGSAIFSMIALSLPYIVSAQTGNLSSVIASNSGYLGMIGNIVIGIGFLGAGLIIKTNDHPHGVTTAALVWIAAAIGILVGVGLTQFAFAAAVVIALLLYVLRKLNISQSLEKGVCEAK
jgi:putative Mg2+ transporter-C (MgtC) family protein